MPVWAAGITKGSICQSALRDTAVVSGNKCFLANTLRKWPTCRIGGIFRVLQECPAGPSPGPLALCPSTEWRLSGPPLARSPGTAAAGPRAPCLARVRRPLPSRPAERGAARGRSGVWWRARAAPARSRRGGGGDSGGSPAAQAHIRVLAATRRGDVTRWRGQHGGGKNERPSPAGSRRRAAGGRRGPARAGPVAPLPTCCPAGPPAWAPRNLVGRRGSVGLGAVGRRLLREERTRAPVRKPPVAQLRRPARPRGPRTPACSRELSSLRA